MNPNIPEHTFLGQNHHNQAPPSVCETLVYGLLGLAARIIHFIGYAIVFMLVLGMLMQLWALLFK